MTELEWLKQESGMTDDELKAMEAVAGAGKFKAFLVKAVAASEQSKTEKQAAEQARLDLENRYQNEFIPEMRKVTQESLKAQGEAAAAKAQLDKAREYGIVPDPPPPPPEVRAPGSPDPAAQEKQFRDWSAAQSRAIITLNDLSAEHFKLFKEPLANSQELVDEVQRQHTLGHRDFNLKTAWETKFKVPEKRQEMQKADEQKRVDDAVASRMKEERQKMGSHPGLVSGKPSRFSTYKPSDGAQASEPWKTSPTMKKAANQPWRDKAASKIAGAA